jgi:hypothetical protein
VRRDGRAAPGTHPERGHTPDASSSPTGSPIIPGGGVLDLEVERRAALDRLQVQEDARRIATALERLAPLRAWYCGRRRDRWAA